MHLAGEEREGVIGLSSALARVWQASTANDADSVVMSGEHLSRNLCDCSMAVMHGKSFEVARKMKVNFHAKKEKSRRPCRVIFFWSM